MALFVARHNTTKDLFCRTFKTHCYQELGFQVGILGCQSNGSRYIWYHLWPKRRLLQIMELWRPSWECFPWGIPERLVQGYICSLAWHILHHGSIYGKPASCPLNFWSTPSFLPTQKLFFKPCHPCWETGCNFYCPQKGNYFGAPFECKFPSTWPDWDQEVCYS